VEGLVNGSLGVEGEPGIDLGGDLAGHNLQDLLAELDKKTVKSSIDLLVLRATVLLGVLNSIVDQSGVFGLLRCGEDERRVGGSILGLVLGNG
jgi:hypothetical protein